jgi:hypothetical protein
MFYAQERRVCARRRPGRAPGAHDGPDASSTRPRRRVPALPPAGVSNQVAGTPSGHGRLRLDLRVCAAVGQCKYAFITDERGGIINDPVLLRLGENHFWLSLADSNVLLWCNGVAHGLGLDVQISEPRRPAAEVSGVSSIPRSAASSSSGSNVY